MIMRSIFSHLGHLMELYTAITKGENIHWRHKMYLYSHVVMYMIGIIYCLLKEGSFMSERRNVFLSKKHYRVLNPIAFFNLTALCVTFSAVFLCRNATDILKPIFQSHSQQVYPTSARFLVFLAFPSCFTYKQLDFNRILATSATSTPWKKKFK